MKNASELTAIVQRLQAMQTSTDQPLQERNFDLFGVNVVTVRYDQPSNLFALAEGRNKSQFAFDDLDALAIEIYERLSEFKLSF